MSTHSPHSGYISSVFCSEGGTQILFDTNDVMHIAALYRVSSGGEEKLTRSSQGLTQTSEGYEMIALSSIDDPTAAKPNATLLIDKKLSDSGTGISLHPRLALGRNDR